MFKVFPTDRAFDTSRIKHLWRHKCSVRAQLDSEEEITLAEFGKNEKAAKSYLWELVNELNAERGGD